MNFILNLKNYFYLRIKLLLYNEGGLRIVVVNKKDYWEIVYSNFRINLPFSFLPNNSIEHIKIKIKNRITLESVCDFIKKTKGKIAKACIIEVELNGLNESIVDSLTGIKKIELLKVKQLPKQCVIYVFINCEIKNYFYIKKTNRFDNIHNKTNQKIENLVSALSTIHLRKNESLNIIVKSFYRIKKYCSYPSKAFIAQILDEIGFKIQKVENTFINGDECIVFTIKKEKVYLNITKKVCGVGAYNVSYNMLGFHWDGQIRAFKGMGYNFLGIDIREHDSFKENIKKIINYNPDYLWLGVENALDFIKWAEPQIKKLKEHGCKVIYWYCDPQRNPQERDLSGLVDYMFLTNMGMIKEYKERYKIQRIFYMPQACSPAFMHQMKCEKKYDIGFAGSLKGNIHRKRIKLLNEIKKRFIIELRNNTRNDIAKFYSECKIVLGIDPDFDSYLYTSNRFFVALGCGAFYLCKFFPGIEKLVKNHKHVVWYKNESELVEMIDRYLINVDDRQRIGNAALALAHKKHTYEIRLNNMIEVINGKSNDFWGFL